jgi:hypothetical protein
MMATAFGLATGFWCDPMVISARLYPQNTSLRLADI